MLLRAKESVRKMHSVATNYFRGLIPSHSFAVSDINRPPRSSNRASRHGVPFKARLFTQCSLEGHSADQEIVIAMGSNVGDRVSAFNRALQQTKRSGVNITRHACLYETAPAYVTDQPQWKVDFKFNCIRSSRKCHYWFPDGHLSREVFTSLEIRHMKTSRLDYPG